jgi:hypothetical protein
LVPAKCLGLRVRVLRLVATMVVALRSLGSPASDLDEKLSDIVAQLPTYAAIHGHNREHWHRKLERTNL